MCISRRKIGAFALALLLAALCLCGCGLNGQQEDPVGVLTTTAPLSGEVTTTQAQADEESDENKNLEIDTYIILNDDATAIKGSGAAYENGRLTISAPGVYSVKGTLSDGQIYVDTDDDSAKVKLYFDGTQIYCSSSAPVYVESSPKETQIILAKGSENKLSDNADRTMTAEQADDKNFATAVIYSKDDLQLEGAGTLTIEANFNKGIFSRDDLQIRGGKLTVTAADDGIRGKDSVEISGGTLHITSGGDGIRTSNEEKGDISVSGGDITVISTCDSIQAVGNVAVSGGTLRLQSGGGYQASLATQESGTGTFGGFGFGQRRPDEDTTDDSGSVSAKGIKADGSIAVSGGTFKLNCLDDALHADENVAVSGGIMQISTNDDGIHAGKALAIAGGEILMEASYEGLEGNTIDIAGGTLDITAQDDGMNAASASDQNDMTFFRTDPAAQDGQTDADRQQTPDERLPANDASTGELSFGGPQGDRTPPSDDGQAPDAANGQGSFGFRRQGGGNMGGRGGMDRADESCVITISGGTVKVNAQGDGMDSNGSIRMSGGTVLVLGPTNGGNGALDYAGSCVVTGGSLCAIGSAGMAQGVSDGSVASLTAQIALAAGDTLMVLDSSGSTLYQVKSEKQASHLVLADPALVRGQSYTLRVNGADSGTCTAR